MDDTDILEGLVRKTQTRAETAAQMAEWIEKAKEVATISRVSPAFSDIVALAVGMSLSHELADLASLLDWELAEIRNAIEMK